MQGIGSLRQHPFLVGRDKARNTRKKIVHGNQGTRAGLQDLEELRILQQGIHREGGWSVPFGFFLPSKPLHLLRVLPISPRTGRPA